MLVRYADDLVVLCRRREEAERALALMRQLLGELGLELKAEKTRIVHLTEGGEGLDFLGFEHRWVRARRGTGRYLLRQPLRGAMQRARDRIRELTERRRLRERPERIVAQVNRYLRGWAGYFRYGHSAERFGAIHSYAAWRLVLWTGKLRRWRIRHRVNPVPFANQLGLLALSGWVVSPWPYQSWRGIRSHAAR